MGITLLQAFKLGFAATVGALAAMTMYSIVVIAVAFIVDVLTLFPIAR